MDAKTKTLKAPAVYAEGQGQAVWRKGPRKSSTKRKLSRFEGPDGVENTLWLQKDPTGDHRLQFRRLHSRRLLTTTVADVFAWLSQGGGEFVQSKRAVEDHPEFMFATSPIQFISNSR